MMMLMNVGKKKELTVLVMPTTACLDAVYAVVDAPPSTELTEAQLTMAPRCRKTPLALWARRTYAFWSALALVGDYWCSLFFRVWFAERACETYMSSGVCFIICMIWCFVHRNTPTVFTRRHRSSASASVSVTGTGGPEMPAKFLTATWHISYTVRGENGAGGELTPRSRVDRMPRRSSQSSLGLDLPWRHRN